MTPFKARSASNLFHLRPGDHQRGIPQLAKLRRSAPHPVEMLARNPHLSRRRPDIAPLREASGQRRTCVAGVRSAEMCAGFDHRALRGRRGGGGGGGGGGRGQAVREVSCDMAGAAPWRRERGVAEGNGVWWV